MVEQPGQYPDEPQWYPEERGTSRWLYVLLAVLAVVVVGAVVWLFLRPGGEGTAAPTATVTTTESLTPTASTTSPSPSPSETVDLGDFSTDPVTVGGFPELGDPIGIGTATRVGHHDGYDRVTFEFSGAGSPSYQVEYTDDPRSQGSGDVVDVKGDAVLHVVISSVGYPDAGASPTPTSPDLGGTVFAQVDPIWGGFEGYGETFVGIDGGKRPFHVEVLQDPTRLVVDVANG